MGPDLLTVRDVARRVGASEKTVRVWIRTGRLRGVMPGGERIGYRILASEVDRLLGIDPPDERFVTGS